MVAVTSSIDDSAVGFCFHFYLIFDCPSQKEHVQVPVATAAVVDVNPLPEQILEEVDEDEDLERLAETKLREISDFIETTFTLLRFHKDNFHYIINAPTT